MGFGEDVLLLATGRVAFGLFYAKYGLVGDCVGGWPAPVDHRSTGAITLALALGTGTRPSACLGLAGASPFAIWSLTSKPLKVEPISG